MIANTVTLSRLLLTFGVVALLGRYPNLDIVLIATIAFIFALDALDGYIARKHNETSKFGETLDTLVDRIIENTFWIYFVARGHIPLWMPITVMARGFIIDELQRYNGSPMYGWAYVLTKSRTSRGLYGTMKMITFLYLASVGTFTTVSTERSGGLNSEQIGILLATITITFCFLRALPSIYGAREKRLRLM